MKEGRDEIAETEEIGAIEETGEVAMIERRERTGVKEVIEENEELTQTSQDFTSI